VETDLELMRPTDITAGRGDPSKAQEKLGWEAKNKMHRVVKMMVEAQTGGDI
jgi:GDPmannose 4,6-dehydratase